MTVKDFLVRTKDYQSFWLRIETFGDNKVLFNKYITDSYDISKNKYKDKKIAAIKFETDFVELILDIGE